MSRNRRRYVWMVGGAVVVTLAFIGVYFLRRDARANDELQEAQTYAAAGNHTEALVRYIRVGKSSASKSVRARAWLAAAEIDRTRKNFGSCIAYLQNAAELDPTSGRTQLKIGTAWIDGAHHGLSQSGAGIPGTPEYNQLAKESLADWWGNADRALARAVELDPQLAEEATIIRQMIPR